jgi:hypothetical protein
MAGSQADREFVGHVMHQYTGQHDECDQAGRNAYAIAPGKNE